MEKNSLLYKVLEQIKKRDALTAAELALILKITKEGARQHLLKIENGGWIEGFRNSAGVGRPKQYYRLTEKGEAEFPDAHAQITVELLQSVRELLGEDALDQLIQKREKENYERYAEKLDSKEEIEEKLALLCQLRTQEGYMANWEEKEGAFYLTENHCPICSAAKECQGFCSAELNNFKQLLGKAYNVERTKHILSEGKRCVYKITPRTNEL
ncbi:metalloregulator ArsR/SmtB family transcription factor [Lishizhenia sp.]|uniref:helix-turn-helix transcriptional regulator n=1 Tax=Lishizhenia sp. TaxID=2497594 RepID=UPI00299D195C|nr:metalloregulator ArsR/SmtB family transcription factor [Lishizhenia sp.]MDX1445629.1 metalloregulator ArsR/SmtB family transcription factor [Lishizhenia sp.]